MGVRLRRELARLQLKNSENFLIIKEKLNEVHFTADSSTYVMQELLLGWAPKIIPDRLLLLAIQHADLYPWPAQAQNKKKSFSLEEAGRNIMRFLEENKTISKNFAYPNHQDPDNYQQFLIGRKLDSSKPRLAASQTTSTMPDITGLSLRKALQHLNKLKLKIQVKGSGQIIGQIPAAGEPLKGISSCTLILEPNKNLNNN